MHTHVFMQQVSNCIFKLASNLLHAAVFIAARPMQQDFCGAWGKPALYMYGGPLASKLTCINQAHTSAAVLLQQN